MLWVDRAALEPPNPPLAKHFLQSRLLRPTKWRRSRWCAPRPNPQAPWRAARRLPSLLQRHCPTWKTSGPRLVPQTTWNTSLGAGRWGDLTTSCIRTWICSAGTNTLFILNHKDVLCFLQFFHGWLILRSYKESMPFSHKLTKHEIIYIHFYL